MEMAKRFGKTPPALHLLALILGKLFGWRVVGGDRIPPDPRAMGIIVPHTSMWDVFFLFVMAYTMGIQANWLVKDTVFKKWYLRWFFRLLGAIPVDRTKSHNMVDAVVQLINEHNNIYLAIAPEGTRTKGNRWRTGFYYIALKAKIPIVLMYTDYKKKETGFGPILTPTGDIQADFKIMKEFYAGVTPKYPERRNDAVIPEE